MSDTMTSLPDLYVWTGRDGQEWSLATRRDRRLADGWVDCDTCDGTGEPFQVVDFNGDVHESCPVCLDGLMPNPQQVEAAARDMYAKVGTRRDSTLTFDIAYPEEQADFMRVAASMLVAAARSSK